MFRVVIKKNIADNKNQKYFALCIPAIMCGHVVIRSCQSSRRENLHHFFHGNN